MFSWYCAVYPHSIKYSPLFKDVATVVYTDPDRKKGKKERYKEL